MPVTLRLTPSAAEARLREQAELYERAGDTTEADFTRFTIESLPTLLEHHDGQPFWLLVPGESGHGESILVDANAPDLRRTLIYVHRDKDSNWSTWEGLTGEDVTREPTEAGRKFSYSATEVELEIDVDLKTGEAWIVKAAGQELARAVKA